MRGAPPCGANNARARSFIVAIDNGQRSRYRTSELERRRDVVDHDPRDRVEERRRRFLADDVLLLREHGRSFALRAENIVQCPGQFRHRGAVDGGMVNLGDQGKTALWQPIYVVQAFDHVHFPRRPHEVERPGMNARRHDLELPPVAGLGKRKMADVKIDVETRITRPVRIGKRRLDNLVAEHRRDVQSFREMADDLPKAQRARETALVVDVDHRDMRRGVRTIHVKEECVLSA